MSEEEQGLGASVEDVGLADTNTVSVSASIEDALKAQEDEKNKAESNENTIELPEKFANAENPQEALLKAYNELQGKLSGNESTPSDGEDTTSGETGGDTSPEGEGEDTGFSLESYQQKWDQNQSLSDEDWDTIHQETGIAMDTLRAYESLTLNAKESQQSATNAENDAKIYNTVGGRDNYDEMISWANDNLSDVQVDALNAQLDNPLFSEMGATMLKNMYETKAVKEPGVNTSTLATSSVGATQDRFLNRADMHKLQSTEAYRNGDPKTHAEFDRKLAGLLAFEASKR